MNKTLTIENVDLKLLEKQRLMLAELLHYDSRTDAPLYKPYFDALAGILSMLDDWADTEMKE